MDHRDDLVSKVLYIFGVLAYLFLFLLKLVISFLFTKAMQ